MSDDEILRVGTWQLQTVVAAVVDEQTPFVVTLTFADGYRASVNLHDGDARNLGIVLRDPERFRELRVNDDSGTIEWPNGYDYDPDSLRMLAIEQHPEDSAAIPSALR